MAKRIFTVLEHPLEETGGDAVLGEALARVAEAHPVLAALLDFSSPDPAQVAAEVGMIYPYEEDSEDDLRGIDFGPEEWFEPSVGLAVIRQSLAALRDDPGSIAAAIYDPGLRTAAVIADLEAIEEELIHAQQHETRFRFATDG